MRDGRRCAPACLRSWVVLQMSFEGIQSLAPVLAVRGEPLVHLRQRSRAKAVQAPASVGAHRDETCLPEDSQVLRDAGLRDPQLVDELADGSLTFAQEVQDLAARGLRYGGERGHTPNI